MIFYEVPVQFKIHLIRKDVSLQKMFWQVAFAINWLCILPNLRLFDEFEANFQSE